MCVPSTPATEADMEAAAATSPVSGRFFSWRKFLLFVGPGFLVSMAYVDPGNLESDLQTGAQTGYSLLWVVLWSTVGGFIIQMLAAKVGVATGKNLAQHARDEYPAAARLLLWVMTEIAIIGADIQEVVGTALAIEILSNGLVPLWLGVLVTAIDAFLFLFLERLGVRKLEAFFGIMVAVMCATFGAMYAQTHVPQWEVLKGFLIPTIEAKHLPQATGMLGALIMPHNIYLHSSLVQSRGIDTHDNVAKREAVFYFRLESALSLAITVVINVAVVSVFAHAYHATHHAHDIGLFNAADYLQRSYGTPVRYIWALGLMAAGQASTMAGTYTGQFVMSGFLDLHVSPWQRAFITRGLAVFPAMFCAVLYRKPAVMDQLNELLNIIQSIQLPFALIPLLYIASSHRIMGSFVADGWEKAFTYGLSVLLLAINGTIVVQTMVQVWRDNSSLGALAALVFILYIAFIVYLLVGPLHWARVRRCFFCNRHAQKEGGSSRNAAGPHITATSEPLLGSQP